MTATGWEEVLFRRLEGFQSFHERAIVGQSMVEPMIDGQVHVVGAEEWEILVRIGVERKSGTAALLIVHACDVCDVRWWTKAADSSHSPASRMSCDSHEEEHRAEEELALSLSEGWLLCRTCSSVCGRCTNSVWRRIRVGRRVTRSGARLELESVVCT